MMRALLSLFLICVASAKHHHKCFSNCQLFNALQRHDFNEHGGYNAAQWVCLAQKRSGACWNHISLNTDDKRYGLFQIPSKWCKEENENWCKTGCHDLLNDDISGDITCLKHLMDTGEVDKWDILKGECSKENAARYVNGCKNWHKS